MIFIKTYSIENRCYMTWNYTVCKCVRASLSLDILQAGAVDGLKDPAYINIQAFQ